MVVHLKRQRPTSKRMEWLRGKMHDKIAADAQSFSTAKAAVEKAVKLAQAVEVEAAAVLQDQLCGSDSDDSGEEADMPPRSSSWRLRLRSGASERLQAALEMPSTQPSNNKNSDKNNNVQSQGGQSGGIWL